MTRVRLWLTTLAVPVETKIAFTVDATLGSPEIPNGTFSLVVPLQLALTGSAAAPAAGIGLLLVALGFLVLHLGRRRAYR